MIAVGAFWTCAAMLVYVYWGYGAMLTLLVRARGDAPAKRQVDEAMLPSVTILLTVHNEERDIEPRLRNLVDQAYPSDRIEILVASDGSTDRTDDIVRAFAREHPARLMRTPRL